jgi:hypothetical protein
MLSPDKISDARNFGNVTLRRDRVTPFRGTTGMLRLGYHAGCRRSEGTRKVKRLRGGVRAAQDYLECGSRSYRFGMHARWTNERAILFSSVHYRLKITLQDINPAIW